MMKHRFVVCIGSNCGSSNVDNAIGFLAGMLNDFKVSDIYDTKAVNGGSRNYSNAVAMGLSDMDPDILENIFKNYELKSGRIQSARERGEVVIDLDIVMVDEVVVRPWDSRQNFFKIGYSELAGSPIKEQSYCQIHEIRYPHGKPG